MSFSADCKTEMCRIPLQRLCCIRAELYGCLLLGHTFSPTALRIQTGHPDVGLRLSALLQKGFGLTFQREPVGRKTIFSIQAPQDLAQVLEAYGHDEALRVAVHLNRGVLENDCCMNAFVRGTFLSGGFVAAPGDKYHLEIATPHMALSRELTSLLTELDLPPKVTVRAGHQTLYYKASESIEDFLTLNGAPVSAMSIMEAKVEKDVRNRVNRKVNCETANSAKTVEAALTQVMAIERLKQRPIWEELSPSLLEAANARLFFPEDTLAELSARLGISKSGLNHRMRRLMELSKHD